jgi:hypothetical protein
MAPELANFRLHPTLHWPANHNYRCLRDRESVFGLAIWLCLTYYATSYKLHFSMNTLNTLAAFQPFVFGMRSLQSTTRCAFNKPCATLDCINYTTIIVALLYSAVLIGTLLAICLTFPGCRPTCGITISSWTRNVLIPCSNA